LADALRSALVQTRPAGEVLVLDDNSQDASAAIAKSSEWGGKVRYVRNETPTGFADAWNLAAQYATGDYVVILHQDDLLDPNYLETMGMCLDRFPGVRHLYTACRYIDADGNLIRTCPLPHEGHPVIYTGREYARRYLDGVWKKQHIHRCPGVMTERRLLLDECRYRKEAGHIADDDFFYRVGKFTDVAGISQPMASFREHQQSVTGKAKLIDLVLARDYLFQIENLGDRLLVSGPTENAVFEKLSVRALNEALYHTLRSRQPEWRDVLTLADKLDTLCSGALVKNLPVWANPMWALARGEHESLAVCAAYALQLGRGLLRRIRTRSLSGLRDRALETSNTDPSS
jgi:glycosyltransferase involved in cell wall biosynthesis